MLTSMHTQIYTSVSEFYERFRAHPRYDETQWDKMMALCYDHVWLAGLALNCTDEVLQAMGTCVCLCFVLWLCLFICWFVCVLLVCVRLCCIY